jgi:hypothetical protein
MLHCAALLTGRGANVDRPFPSGLVAGAADGHSSDMKQFKLALLEGADFIRMFKALEDDVVHKSLLATSFKDQR